MSIISFKERERTPLSQREDYSVHGNRSFEVVSDNNTTTLTTIKAHGSCPAVGAAHPDNSAATLRYYEVEQPEGHEEYQILKCIYDSKQTSDDDGVDDVSTALVKAGFRAQDREVPAIFDGFGSPIINTAGDLLPGLTRFANEFIAPVTMRVTTYPTWLFALNNTLNDTAKTMRGIVFPPGTLLLKNVSAPDEPEVDAQGVGYWSVTFDIIHNPDGFFELHPNQGFNELVYQINPETDPGPPAVYADPPNWEDATYADYDAADSAQRRVIKRRIRNHDGQGSSEPQWLDQYGRAVKILSLTGSSVGLAAIAQNSTTLTANSAVFDPTTHVGAAISIGGAGPHGRTLVTRIASISGTGAQTTCTLEDAASTAVVLGDSEPIYLPGALCLRVVKQPVADWTSVVLPNNDP